MSLEPETFTIHIFAFHFHVPRRWLHRRNRIQIRKPTPRLLYVDGVPFPIVTMLKGWWENSRSCFLNILSGFSELCGGFRDELVISRYLFVCNLDEDNIDQLQCV